MKSRIYMSEVITNKDRLFGSDPEYLQALVFKDGEVVPAYITFKQLEIALERARRNPEDHQKLRLWTRFCIWLYLRLN